MNKIYKDTKYDHIRKLVADWYDGRTSQADEADIFDFFAKADLDELPSDLRDEALVFGTVGNLSGSCPDKDLLKEIDAAVKAEKEKPRSKFAFVYWLSAIAVAASISLLVFTGIRFDTGSLATRPTERKVAVQTDSDTVTVVEQPWIDRDIEVKQVEQPVVVRTKLRKTELIAAVDSYREVEDPDEAARILDAIQKKYDETLEASAYALSTTARSLNDADRLINDAFEKL